QKELDGSWRQGRSRRNERFPYPGAGGARGNSVKERDEEQHVATAGGRRITLLVLERAEEERRQHLERAGEVPRGELSLSLPFHSFLANTAPHRTTMSLAVIVVSLLLLRGASQPSVMAQMPDVMPRGQIGGEAGIERAMSLFRIWEEAYGLKPDVHLPPAKITLPAIVPRAPHLEDCEALTTARKESERRGGDGEPPLWARAVNNCSECNPQPPWVCGSDAGNLPLTRVVQRDLWWEHQLFPLPFSLPCLSPPHLPSRLPSPQPGARVRCGQSTADASGTAGPVGAPAASPASSQSLSPHGSPHLPSRLPSSQPTSCDGRRLLVVPWPTKTHHGVGSQIHVMSTFLSLALSHNRTFPSLPPPSLAPTHRHHQIHVMSTFLSLALIHNRTLVPAPGSTGGAWGCYFPIVNPECERVVSATKTGGAWGCYFFPIVNPDCERVVSDMTASSTMPPLSSDKVGHNRLAASGDPVVHLNASCDSQMKLEARAANERVMRPGRADDLRLWRGEGGEEVCEMWKGLWGDAYARAPNVVDYTHSGSSRTLTPNIDGYGAMRTRGPRMLWGDAFARAPNVVEYMGEQPPAETNHPVVRACVRSLSHGSGCALVAIPVGALHNALVGGVAPTPRALVAIPINALHAALALASHVHWWRSQSTRFMLRWPSPHTCHQINKERHTAYGLLTASHLSRYTETQTEILRAVAGNTSESPESKKLSEISAGPPGPIESQVWTVRGFAGCKETCMSAADAKAIKETYASLGGEPFVMRPIVSVHVRQSDKGTEMRLSPLATHMFFVHRLRRHVPDLRHVWLNTEMEVRCEWTPRLARAAE
ncbi:unnamed protein product, partial [Closterium sp. Naga37s-1]